MSAFDTRRLVDTSIRTTTLGLLSWLAVAAVGCATAGTATGELVKTGAHPQAVTFVWHSDPGNPNQGDISVTLPDGSHYAGRYSQITRTTPVEVLAPMWVGWTPYWNDWDVDWDVAVPDGLAPYDTFITEYTGRVIARLVNSKNGKLMRCRFHLDEPTEGLAGGGEGSCQLHTGETIRNAVLSSP